MRYSIEMKQGIRVEAGDWVIVPQSGVSGLSVGAKVISTEPINDGKQVEITCNETLGKRIHIVHREDMVMVVKGLKGLR